MSRSLSGEASPEEEASLFEALQQDAALQQQYDILKHTWPGGQTAEENSPADNELKKISRILQLATVRELIPSTEETQHVQRRIKRRRRIIIKVIMYAGVAMAATLLTWMWVQDKSVKKATVQAANTGQTIATQNGSRTRTMLPDGTTVWLNAGSKIYFDNDFASATRDVKLEGEAYFDVVKNPNRPFIVHTAGIDIKVLGTVFNVRSYPADKTVETTLIRGLVQVTRQGYPQQKPVYLHPNEKLVVQKSADEANNTAQANGTPQVSYKVAKLDTTVKEIDRIETAWVYNRLEFRGENFEALARKMERWYNVSIVFEDDNVKQQTFNGSFENETVEQAFIALKTAAPFSFSIQGHEIRIRSLGKK